nr:KH domain-containing, RNA-binding, signal transduction-associated protein 3 isoform X4 [Callithrix jacchus]
MCRSQSQIECSITTETDWSDVATSHGCCSFQNSPSACPWLVRNRVHSRSIKNDGKDCTGNLSLESNKPEEIEKFQKGEGKDEEKYIDVVINKNMKLGQKVLIPVKQFPKFNFVGKLLGPRGNSLKRLQEETLTKMSILGKGSMRDKAKEEELRKSGEAKYFHLNDDLHVLIEVFAPPAEAYARMGHALEEIKKFLIPDYNDEIRQAQLQELTYLNGGSENADVPVVRGKPTLRTRGVPAPAITRGRGGVTARPVGVVVPRGTPTPRGVLSTRGPVSRGRGLLTPRARGVPPTGYRPPPPPPTQETYGEYDYDDGYGTAYDEQSYDSYENSYSTPAQS